MFAARWIGALGVAVAVAGPALAQVYKCTDAHGKTEYSNLACPQGAKVSAPVIKSNTVDASGMRLQNQLALQRQWDEQQRPQQPALMSLSGPISGSTGHCPSDIELRNMETSATSTTMGRKEREFLQDEIRRVRQCRAGQGRYTREDWAISRQAQDDQNSLTNRARGRARAEGMHSAADPLEGQRIHERRIAREAARAQQDMELERAQQHGRAADSSDRARKANRSPVTVQRCDGAACWGNDGLRYVRTGPAFRGPQGSCRLVGGHMNC